MSDFLNRLAIVHNYTIFSKTRRRRHRARHSSNTRLTVRYLTKITVYTVGGWTRRHVENRLRVISVVDFHSRVF